MITINDVAKKAKVSKSSVSRVINGNYEYMSEDLKKRILKAMEELNYMPNTLAQSLKKKRTQMIGIILSDISNPFWSEVLKGAQKECLKYGYLLIVSTSDEDPVVEEENVISLKNRQVDGLILNTTGQNTEEYRRLVEEEYPLVFLDRIHTEMKVDTVNVNNILGSKLAIEYLLNQGHEKIGILSYPTENKSPREERIAGYKKTLIEHGVTIDESLIKVCKQEPGSGIDATLELLDRSDQVTAIFSTHATLNLEILTGVRKAGLKVPDDVSVIGYDDFPWVPLLDPPLSTVAQPAFELGVRAAQMLISKMENEDKSETEMFQLNPELIIRNSCASPKVIK